MVLRKLARVMLPVTEVRSLPVVNIDQTGEIFISLEQILGEIRDDGTYAVPQSTLQTVEVWPV